MGSNLMPVVLPVTLLHMQGAPLFTQVSSSLSGWAFTLSSCRESWAVYVSGSVATDAGTARLMCLCSCKSPPVGGTQWRQSPGRKVVTVSTGLQTNQDKLIGPP